MCVPCGMSALMLCGVDGRIRYGGVLNAERCGGTYICWIGYRYFAVASLFGRTQATPRSGGLWEFPFAGTSTCSPAVGFGAKISHSHVYMFLDFLAADCRLRRQGLRLFAVRWKARFRTRLSYRHPPSTSLSGRTSSPTLSRPAKRGWRLPPEPARGWWPGVTPTRRCVRGRTSERLRGVNENIYCVPHRS